MNNDVYWVGISLNPNDNPRIPRSRFSHVHDNIVSALTQPSVHKSLSIQEYPSGACVHSYPLGPRMDQLVDIFDAMGLRIGFGIRTTGAQGGKTLIPKVTDLLNRMGVSLPVSVWTWSPASVPSYSVRKVAICARV